MWPQHNPGFQIRATGKNQLEAQPKAFLFQVRAAQPLFFSDILIFRANAPVDGSSATSESAGVVPLSS
jgi:hypothetical protein